VSKLLLSWCKKNEQMALKVNGQWSKSNVTKTHSHFQGHHYTYSHQLTSISDLYFQLLCRLTDTRTDKSKTISIASLAKSD